MMEQLDETVESARTFLSKALDRGILDSKQLGFLSDCLSEIPDHEGSGLDAGSATQFIHTTLQLLEACLEEEDRPRAGFVNPIVQEELSRACRKSGGNNWILRTVCDGGRSGTDRRFTFGQVKQKPGDPDDPSFFGGVWLADCDGAQRRVVFSIVADMIPGSEEWNPVGGAEGEIRILEDRVRRRGPTPWSLQVEPDSPLGRWIARLTGTTSIGQHRGHIPLGVLGEAVRRALEPKGLSHLLLGPSRRDPPTEPWHTGSFLRQIEDSFDFEWQGLAIDTSREALVEARCVIGLRGKILHILDR